MENKDITKMDLPLSNASQHLSRRRLLSKSATNSAHSSLDKDKDKKEVTKKYSQHSSKKVTSGSKPTSKHNSVTPSDSRKTSNNNPNRSKPRSTGIPIPTQSRTSNYTLTPTPSQRMSKSQSNKSSLTQNPSKKKTSTNSNSNAKPTSEKNVLVLEPKISNKSDNSNNSNSKTNSKFTTRTNSSTVVNEKSRSGSVASLNSPAKPTTIDTKQDSKPLSKPHSVVFKEEDEPKASNSGRNSTGKAVTISGVSTSTSKSKDKDKSNLKRSSLDKDKDKGKDTTDKEIENLRDKEETDVPSSRSRNAQSLVRARFASIGVDLDVILQENAKSKYIRSSKDQEEGGEDFDGSEQGDFVTNFIDNHSSFNSKRVTSPRLNMRSMSHNDVIKSTISNEIYKHIEITTIGDLMEAKSSRRSRLDAYCSGRSILAPPMEEVEPLVPLRNLAKQEYIDSYQLFWERIQEISEDNNLGNNDQILCIFTANLVRNKKTWNEDCNLLESAIGFLSPYMEPSGCILWVRCGNQKEWKDPSNPFRTDNRLMLKTLPTIIVWETEKRLGGNRLFQMDNLCVMLED